MTTIPATTPAPARAQGKVRTKFQTRRMLLIYAAVAILLALLAIAQASSAYQTAYNLFEQIAVTNSTKVNAAEEALQRLANTSQATADYTALTSDTPLFEQAQNNIFRNFQAYRDQMFILQSNLHSADEQSAFSVADTYTYSRFWRHVSNLMAQRSDLSAATREYLFADAHLRNEIIPALQQLEALNFNEMVDAGKSAALAINGQILVLIVLAVGAAALLTYVSFWVRGKVRRYITPGIDAAVVIAWVLILLMIPNLLSLPGQLQTMTQNAYFNISGASRVLVMGNQANRAESSAIIDQERKSDWYQQFDDDTKSVELRLCGQVGCTNASFVESGTSDTPDPVAVADAHSISSSDAAFIGGVSVLMGNIAFPGETAALEKARLAYRDYVTSDAGLRQKIDAGDITGAVELNTDSSAGSNEDAFTRFVNAMDELRTINRTVFDDIWTTQQTTLPSNKTLYGVIGYLAIIGLVMVGVYHRYREL